MDFLSTEEIMAYFKTYNPKKIEWLNDSSCNMIFESENLAERAYKELTLTKNYDSGNTAAWGIVYNIFSLERNFSDPKGRAKIHIRGSLCH